jgi:hypothetical protein
MFAWYRSTGRKGFTQARKVRKSFDEQDPRLVFAKPKQTTSRRRPAGLTDIVRIR